MFKKEEKKDRHRLSSQRPVATLILARQSRQRSRRRSFEHKECFTESASHAGKAVFFSKERVSLVCGEFCARHRTWAYLAEGSLFDVSFLPDFLNNLFKGMIDLAKTSLKHMYPLYL